MSPCPVPPPQVLNHRVCLPAPLPLLHRMGLALSPSEGHTLLELWACVSLSSPVPSVPAVVSASCTLDDCLLPAKLSPCASTWLSPAPLQARWANRCLELETKRAGRCLQAGGMLGGTAPSHLLPAMHTPRPHCHVHVRASEMRMR